MRAMRVCAAGAAAALAVALLATTAAAQAAKVDVTGKWLMTVTTDTGTTEPSITLKQDGEKLTGHYSSATLGEADVEGTVKGQNITITFQADMQGQAIPVTYAGTVESKDSMKGTLDIAGGTLTGTFTAKRQ